MININGNNHACDYTQQQGNMNICGNMNKITLNYCEFIIRVNGNGNVINLNNCKIQTQVNGNGNSFQLDDSHITIGIIGNGNSFVYTNQIKNNSSIHISFNQGSFNTFPQYAIVNQQNTQKNNNKRIRANSNNNMNFRSNAHQQFNNANFVNQIQYPPPPIFNPRRSYQSNNMNQPNYMNCYDYNNINPFQNSGSQGYAFQTRQNANTNNNSNSRTTSIKINPYGISQKPSNIQYASRYNSQFPNLFQNKKKPIYIPQSDQQSDIKINHLNMHDEQQDSFEQIPRFIPKSNSRKKKQKRNNNNGNEIQPRYAYNQNNDIRALTQQQLDRLNISKYLGQIINCSICLEDICKGHDVIFLFCFHSFHSKCVKNWLKKSAICPMCQLDLTTYLQ